MSTSVSVECPLSQLNASLQDPQGVVVPARAGQGAAQVVERRCDIDAVGSGTPLAQADGSPRDSDGLLEVNGGDEHIAEIEQGRDELNALGSVDALP